MIFADKVHTENILQQLWEDCGNEELCDVVLIAADNEETRIPAHRIILSAASAYFKGMFQSSMRESATKEINLPSGNVAILRSLIEYCYIGRVAITKQVVDALLKLADFLRLSNVVTACGKFLSEQLHPSNCLGLALFAEQHRCEILLKTAKDYSLEHFMDVSKSQEFLSLNSKQLGEFLASDKLNVQAEEHVFEILMTWIQHDQINREKHKDHLLKLVRLPLLERLFLIEKVKPICTSSDSFQLYVNALERNSLPDAKTIKARKSIKADQSLLCLTHNSNDSEIRINFYSPHRRKWIRRLKNLEFRCNFGVAVMDDNLYVVGGMSADYIVLNTVICINLKTLTIGQINPMTECRYGFGAAAMNGYLYAVGGINEGNTLSSVEKWDPKTNTWSKVASMSVRRHSFGIAQLNEKLYAVGGYCIDKVLKSAEYYDVDQNVWKSIAEMKNICTNPSVAIANGFLYVVSYRETLERYDPQSNKWTTLCSLYDSDLSLCTKFCTTFCNKVVVCFADRFYEYNDKTNKWEMKEILNGITHVECIIPYSGELPVAEFAEN